MNFSCEVSTDPATGWNVVALRHRRSSSAVDEVAARILPALGANLFSWVVGGQDLLYHGETLRELAARQLGSPILFPTPNRVRDAMMVWQGRSFAFAPNDGRNFIHGLVRGRPWQHEIPRATADAASLDTWIDWDESQPEFSRFPIRHCLSVTYTLGVQGRSMRIDYAVENRDRAPLPFGFGLHPFFRIPGRRADVHVQVPAPTVMELQNLLPTGKLLPVEGTRFDLRQPVSLEKLNLDDVYCDLAPGAQPGFEWRDRGVRVTLAASPEFSHMVVYTPAGREFFCMENQTCSTDAHNLHERGLRREARLLIAAPGETHRGWADWRVERG